MAEDRFPTEEVVYRPRRRPWEHGMSHECITILIDNFCVRISSPVEAALSNNLIADSGGVLHSHAVLYWRETSFSLLRKVSEWPQPGKI